MPQLDNPRHERFAALVASGKSDIEAYQLALGADYDNAHSNAWRLKADEGVIARIKELSTVITEKTLFSVVEKKKFLHEFATKSPCEMSDDSPFVQVISGPDGVTTKTPSASERLKAVELHAKLAGELDGPPVHGLRLHLELVAGSGANPEALRSAEKPAIDVDSEVIIEADYSEGSKEQEAEG